MFVQSDLEDTAKETVKFALVGGSGIIVNFIVLSIALYLLYLPESIALALGILVSMSTNYILNRIWTFDSQKEIPTEYLRYITLNLIGILIQYFVALGLEIYFSSIGFSTFNLVLIAVPTIYLASLTGILFGFVSNFLFSKYFVFI